MTTNIENTKWYSYTSSTQTMRTWAREIKAQKDIPDQFQATFPQFEGTFPYTIFIPEEKVSKFQQRNSTILVVFNDHIVLLEQLDNEVKVLSSQFKDVFTITHGVILLKSWLNIETEAGTFAVKFNTANDHLFIPIIKTIRQKMMHSRHQDTHSAETHIEKTDLSKFDFLDKVNFKFMNYGRRCVQNQDSVLVVVYQPEQTLQDIQLFRKTLYKRYKTDFLVTLTEAELILIKEDEPIRTNFSPAHGGVFTYIPRHRIEDITFISQPEDSNCVMEITLPNETKLTCELTEENEALPRLQRLLGK